MLKVAITGSTGLVGSRIVALLNNEFSFIPLQSSSVDITNKGVVNRVLNDIDFDILLHLAGYTNVDGAETQKETAHKVNVEGTKHLFEAVKHKQKKMIYISTDFVFDGQNPPFYEDSKPNPIGYYGQTKYEGEQVVKNKAMIVRISYPYRASFEPKKDLVRTIKYLLEQKKELTMVTDSLMVPTFIDDIAFALSYLMNNYSSEIFHIVGGNALSPFDAGKLIAKRFKLDEGLINATTYEEYFAGKAKRPQYSDTRSNKNNFFTMKTFEEGLQLL